MDLIIGMAILVVAFMPLAFSFVHERQLLRAEYSRAVAVEIVDGEMEILAAGEWQNLPEGQQAYTVHAQAAGRLAARPFSIDEDRKTFAPRMEIGQTARYRDGCP